MDRVKLNIRYHNPKSDEDMIRYILPIFVGASKDKLDNILREAASGDHKESFIEVFEEELAL